MVYSWCVDFPAVKLESFIWLSCQSLSMQGESALINPTSVKYYSRMEDSHSAPNIAAAAMASSNLYPVDNITKDWTLQMQQK